MKPEPKDLLHEAWIPTYKERIGVLQDQLTEVRSALFVLEHIARFPFDLFGVNRNPFWYLVRRSLETFSVVALWRILLDEDARSLTLRKLKEQIKENALDDSAKERIVEALRDVDTGLEEIEGKVTRLRHKHLAHLDERLATQGRGSSHVTSEELRELADAAHDLINAIGFGGSYATLYLEYDQNHGQRIKSDVEALFDDIVERSKSLHMPEREPELFRVVWRKRTPPDRAQFNEYRRRFHLPEILSEGD